MITLTDLRRLSDRVVCLQPSERFEMIQSVDIDRGDLVHVQIPAAKTRGYCNRDTSDRCLTILRNSGIGSQKNNCLQFRRLDGDIFGYLGQFGSRTTHYGTDARALRRAVVVAKTTLIVVACDSIREKRKNQNQLFNFSFRGVFYASPFAYVVPSVLCT